MATEGVYIGDGAAPRNLEQKKIRLLWTAFVPKGV